MGCARIEDVEEVGHPFCILITTDICVSNTMYIITYSYTIICNGYVEIIGGFVQTFATVIFSFDIN